MIANSPQYLESGNYTPGHKFVDDSQLLTHDPGPIARIIVYGKKFIWGLQVIYADGSTSGIHNGFMEPTIEPECKELILSSGESINKISGYSGEFIGALRITTNSGQALDIGSMPLGNLFSIQMQGCVIQKIVYGFTGYLNYIGGFLTPPAFTYPPIPSMPSSSPTPTTDFPLMIYPNPCVRSQTYREGTGGNSFKRPSLPSNSDRMSVEFSAMYGHESSIATAFNDYEDVVKPALKDGFKVKISRVKIYKKENILLGIKVVYSITDLAGKVKKVEKPHYGKNVGFFTGREAMNFKEPDYLLYVAGRAKNSITKIKIASSNKKDVIEFGVNVGSEFNTIPKRGIGIIAFAGSFDTCLRTLRTYSLY